ncbi:EAL domain-containing protein [Roseomonas gilardii subsp. gilardii]|uniref:putative bifunctional diguanylate cyclase/phosphodiesterase n=1 Tax=Roseomonas gilardii TaxID=257708 RepID=UPI001FF7F897|nr:bifunctional diguanylate cyclase/phosphodiesterase [Roseomonas gilardii]UPG74099.1 EAL domain-containing protein [Roseomonas gilardii subsp. gilardii]
MSARPNETPASLDASQPPLEGLIRLDQLRAVRRSVLISLPVTMLLSLSNLVMANYGSHGEAGLIWFWASITVNLLRSLLCGFPPRAMLLDGRESRAVRLWFQAMCLLAWCSGMIWAAVPVLCDGYTTPQAPFFLVVVCGITAGAVVHGTAYARVPICFITPALFSVIVCLVWAGSFEQRMLAATVALYTAALVRSAWEGERAFLQASRSKQEARALATSLHESHRQTLDIAEDLRHRATHDMLTQVLNRAGFMQALDDSLAQASPGHAPLRMEDGPHCLMLLDLDGFKSVNDLFGHKAGDLLLAEVAQRLRQALPRGYVLGRLGGDEFAVLGRLSPNTLDPEREAAELATRLTAAVAIPFTVCEAGRVGVSIGVFCDHPPGSPSGMAAGSEEMLSCADAALYAAKRSGRNRFCLFDDTLRRQRDMTRDIERDLPRALAEGGLQVHYQPLLRRPGGTLAGMEALIRWNHPRHGPIDPPAIILAAANSGQAEPLLRFILRDVCRMIATLRGMGHAEAVVSMNVSPREMTQFGVARLIMSTLAEFGVPAGMLEIELTEEAMMDLRIAQAGLDTLGRAGVRIAIDDFGVGFASLGSLQKLEVDRIKIDRSFISGMVGARSDQVLVQAVLSLARSLEIEVVAEGVENEETLQMLDRFGCPIVQGYHLSPPLPPAALLDRVRQWDAALPYR